MERVSDTPLSPEGKSRRNFVKKAVYVPPSILTLQAAPAYAKYGSEKPGNGWGDDNHDHEKDNDKEAGKGKVSAASESSPLATPPIA